MLPKTLCCAALLYFAAVLTASAAENPTKGSADEAKTYRQMVDRAIGYLLSQGQSPEGAFNPETGPGVTAVVLTGILRHGRTPADPAVAKSLKYLEGFVQPDGGVYAPKSFYKNYETSLALMAFAEANRDGRYKKIIRNADKFLKGQQWGADQKIDKTSYYYGGAGYGKHKRPDLSNTQFFLEALKASGTKPDDAAVQRALVFVSRCQNLESAHNTTPFPVKNPDGGFYYTPAAGGVSQAGTLPDGGLRSYGSMTYAGLKSMIYAGVKADDPRVKAALKWIQAHYDLSANPGLGNAGLYYYYQTFAKALNAVGKPQLIDAKGVAHDWRSDLIQALAERQRPDGSWLNDNPRWMEGFPNLDTGYALLALSYCKR
ncbi:MAG: terpene cyclase/mutase family protein [Pirellulales bacterium]|nr:terpene cyclase/mutase family protein [Pirellulales bacterium]